MSAPPKQRLLALLATGRVANLPTVWTNVLGGVLLAYPWLSDPFSELLFLLGPLLLGCLLASCFYVGGSFLGDASDARWDAKNHPNRPIPLGILSSTRVAFAGYALLAGGWFGACVFDSLLWAARSPTQVLPAVQTFTPHSFSSLFDGIYYERVVISSGLVLSIFLYAKFHRGLGVGAPLLMALCRGLLVLWAGSLTGIRFATLLEVTLLPYALCLIAYTLALGLLARQEARPKAELPPPLLHFLYALLPVAIVISLGWLALTPMIGIAGAAFFGWSLRNLVVLRRSLPAFVSRSIAGVCLLDAMFATLIGWQAALLCLTLFLLALLLQRFVPTT